VSQYPSMPVWSGLATPILAFTSPSSRKTLPLKGQGEGAVGFPTEPSQE
jgi:hypothetical protein